MDTPQIEIKYEQIDGIWAYFYNYCNFPLTYGPFANIDLIFDDIDEQYDMTEPTDFDVDPRG